MSNWTKFKKWDSTTHPTKIGWYYVTTNFSDPNSFNPSSDIKLIGIAHWSGELNQIRGGFDTLKNDMAGIMLSDNITDRVIAYQEIVFPEAAKDDLEPEPTEDEDEEDEDEYI